uniref:Uncharacterized protein n=1 Tax=Timema poppense TaxID=170557 RepID=A0A7R9DI11_TIMPO|nr:unnamed protein product [Timema poppensis]
MSEGKLLFPQDYRKVLPTAQSDIPRCDRGLCKRREFLSRHILNLTAFIRQLRQCTRRRRSSFLPLQHLHYSSSLPLFLNHPLHPNAASFPSPPTFIQPAPPTFIAAPAPGPPIINFVTPGPQGQFTAQLTPQPYPPFQGYAAVAPAQPPELYQPQGGITYYSPEEQIIPRPIAQKRQRAAIPIVPPPERSPRGRGRTQEEQIDMGMRHDGSGDAQLSLVSEQFEDATTTQDIEVRHDQFNMAGDCGVPLPAVSTNIEQDTLA